MDSDGGAIFMSDRNTRQECITRNIFGLPASQAGFMKKLKTGMLLFLFERDERKLYGVFEATSDGAWNIVPAAFISSGKSFPAQILFRRIWICKPLLEDEFCDAIKENYYAPRRFHFRLTSQQVYRLLDLFFPKKIPVELNEKPRIPNQVIQAFEKSRARRFHSDVNNTDNDIGSSSHPGCLSGDIGQSIQELGSVALDFHPSLAQECPDYTRSNFGHNYPCHTTHFITPRGETKDGMTSPSMHRSVAEGFTNASHQEPIWRRQHCLDIRSSSFPLSQEDTRKSSEFLNISLKDELDALDSLVAHEDLKPNQTAHDECYPMLHSDTDQRRTSAFDRLGSHEGFVPCKQEIRDSQLLKTISEGRNQRSINRVVESDQGIQILNFFMGIGEIEQSDAVALSSHELPFLNFKRRTVTETKGHVVTEEGEGKYKRRRLMRPSFAEEEWRHTPDSSQIFAQHVADKNTASSLSKTKSDEIDDLSGQIGIAISADDRRLESVLAQGEALGIVPKSKELNANNASEVVHSGAGAQALAQYGVDKNVKNSLLETKSDKTVDALHESCFDATATSVDLPRQRQRVMKLTICQGSKCCGGGVADAIPTWLRLKSIIAQANTSGTDKESNK